MTFAFLVFTVGVILLDAGLTHRSIPEVLQGLTSPDEPQRPEDDPSLTYLQGASDAASAAGTAASSVAISASGAWGGSKAIVDAAIEIGKVNHLRVISTKRATKATASGGVSDHWIGSKLAYAADQSNGGSPTPEMDKTAAAIAAFFGIPWSGSGLASKVIKSGGHSFRLQLIYRTNIGGNHFNHVHFGARRI